MALLLEGRVEGQTWLISRSREQLPLAPYGGREISNWCPRTTTRCPSHIVAVCKRSVSGLSCRKIRSTCWIIPKPGSNGGTDGCLFVTPERTSYGEASLVVFHGAYGCPGISWRCHRMFLSRRSMPCRRFCRTRDLHSGVVDANPDQNSLRRENRILSRHDRLYVNGGNRVLPRVVLSFVD
jgi:hypothetical protein